MRRFVLCFAAVTVISAAAVPAVASIKVHGAIVDDEAKKIGDDRFQSKEDWEKTIRFYKSAYGGKAGYVWFNVETPPKVKAVHIENTHSGRTWEGINIYQTENRVYVYVIKAEKRKK